MKKERKLNERKCIHVCPLKLTWLLVKQFYSDDQKVPSSGVFNEERCSLNPLVTAARM